MSDAEAAPPPRPDAVAITVNGREIEATKGELVISAAQRHGVYIPRFCYHERMDPVGMCRMCLVDIDTGRGPALQPACMINVADGMKVDTESDRTKKAQEGVLEFLLINHPLDCPVCDKGGECPLQDQTMSHGPGESRFVEEKRHFEKPINISPLVLLDRERCILCDRCTRFAKEVAGDPLIHFTQRGNQTQVLTFPDEPFSSYFSGNTVQICPVGALTAAPYRFRARPWDLEQVESTCTSCSMGCRVVIQSSRDQILRYSGVDADAVNWGWLCDRGRFDFESVNSEDRLGAPLVRKGQGDASELVETSWSEALDAAAAAIDKAMDAGGPGAVAVIGGARGTNEDAYAWAKLAKGVIGTDSVDAQLGDGLPPEVLYGLPRATIDEAGNAKTVILLGVDLKEEVPVLYLRVRDAAQRRTARLLELTNRTTGLTPYAWRTLIHGPGEVGDLVGNVLGTSDEHAAVREQLGAGSVVVVVGRGNLAESPAATVDALVRLRDGLPGVKFLSGLRRGNVHGALDMGLSPGLLPGRHRLDAGEPVRAVWNAIPTERGLDTQRILEAAADGRISCLILLGSDPLSDFPDRDLAQRALARVATTIAVDTFLTTSSSRADVVLAAAGYAEKAGTTTNLEGRVSELAQKVTAVGTARPDWMIAAELAYRLDDDLGFVTLDELQAEIRAVSPPHAELTEAALRRQRDGIVAEGTGDSFTLTATGHEAPGRSSYDFRLVTSRKLYDAAVGVDKSPSLRNLAPPAALHLHPLDLERLGVVTGGVVKVSSPRTTANLLAVADPGLERGSAWLGFNLPDASAADFVDAAAGVTSIRVETVPA